MPSINLNGTSIYYEEHGVGMPLVFIHGHGLMHTMFHTQIEHFSKHYRVIVCDLRGNGHSGKLKESYRDTIETQCIDLIILLNELHLHSAVFVGMDYGGIIVQHLAVQYPERVQAIVIADGCSAEAASIFLKALQYAAAYSSILFYLAPSESSFPATRLLYKKWALSYAIIRKSLLMKRPAELYKQKLAMIHYPSTARLQEITCPTLILAGDADVYRIECTKVIETRILDVKVEILTDCMYPSNLCQPERFNSTLERFLVTMPNLKEQAGG
ncbi:AB hydrolase superfamily protein YdjP [compost metagenome]